MVQTITTLDLIRRAMYLISAISAGETPNSQDANDALSVLNELIDSWNLRPLIMYGSPNEDWILTPGRFTYDWGSSAVAPNFTSERPNWLMAATCTRNGFTTPVEIITQDQYNEISLKSTSSPLVERILFINSFPLAQVICFPVPSEAVTLNLSGLRSLQGPTTLQSTIALPPGYIRALRYNLAAELWPEYPNATTDINSVKMIAKEALSFVKVANSDITPSTFESIPNIDIGRSWDWRAS